MQTRTLKPKTAEMVQELARVNVDSSEGFLKAAEVVENPTLSSMFREYARQRASFAAALTKELGTEATEKAKSGSLKAQVHRWWIELRGKLSGQGDHALLAEAERGEDQIKAAYEEVIGESTGTPVHELLREQLRLVTVAHDRIRDMRDAAAAKMDKKAS